MAETEVKTIIKIETGESEVTIGGLRKREGDGDPVPYDLSAAERIRLALVGHGAHVFASGVIVSGEDNNIASEGSQGNAPASEGSQGNAKVNIF